MNRAEFMAALEAQLRDITTEERDEALKFYNEYLDEAGPENEAAVLA
ncbi:MAG: HAAS signaling domain-containing protein, partial [Ruthenibacterium lactatiformans]